MGTGLRITAADDEWALATRPGLFLSVWRGEVRASHVAELDRLLPRLVAESESGRYAAISIIERTIELPFDEDARKLSMALQKRFERNMICQAYLVEGSGFLPATVRTLTAGLSLVNRAPYATKVFSDVPSLVSWVGPQLTDRHDPLADAIHEVRATV